MKSRYRFHFNNSDVTFETTLEEEAMKGLLDRDYRLVRVVGPPTVIINLDNVCMIEEIGPFQNNQD